MEKYLGSLFIAVLLLAGCTRIPTEPGSISNTALSGEGNVLAKGGFDMYGYNDRARLFNGAADGVDRNLDGTFWGDQTYAADHLVMKWNAEWNRGNDEGWTNPPYNAWDTNHWNGQVPGGSGEIWHYKIIWVGSDLEDSQYWREGGYPIWGQFEVIFSQGTVANEHFWETHANPTGLNLK
ncbi:MAG: hypothetical protein P8Y60_16320 [Calditrichota bacterium]